MIARAAAHMSPATPSGPLQVMWCPRYKVHMRHQPSVISSAVLWQELNLQK